MHVQSVTEKHIAVGVADLVEVRTLLHHVVQVIPSVARAYLEREPDDSHTNMGWDESAKALIGRRVEAGNRAFQVGVCVADPAVLYYQDDPGRADRYPLASVTLTDVHRWLEGKIAATDLDVGKIDWKPGFDLPRHPISSRGVAFDLSELNAAAMNLATWFGRGFAALKAVEKWYGAVEPRCWPHHFDVGTLLSFGKNSKSEAQFVGVGLSPGDNHYPEPYYYVSPWPEGDVATLPALESGGRWHTSGFVSAVLDASAIYDARDQAELVRGYLEESIEVSKSRLELD